MLALPLWERQVAIARAVTEHDRVAVRSGHKIGKSDSAAALALWWVSDPIQRPGARVVMTSSSARQVKSILWKAVKRLYKNARQRGFPLGGVLHKNPDNGLQYEDGREIIGFSTKEPEKFAGYSGKWLLFILDEGSGIAQEIYDAIEGNRAGGARLLVLSNPTKTSGEFFEAFNSKAHLYHCIIVSSLDTPNATSGIELIPGLATLAWCKEKLLEWGADDPRYQVRVLGNFPGQASNSVVSLSLTEAAFKRWVFTVASKARELLYVGVDPAREGDDETAIYFRRGLWGLEVKTLRKGDSIDTAGEILKEIKSRARLGERPRVNVDVVGIGAGIYDELKRDESIEVFGISGSSRPTEKGYVNLRDQLWFGVEKWFKAGGSLPFDGKLKADLLAPTYSFQTKDLLKVELKKDIKKRLKRSPDRGDALALSLYEAPSTIVLSESAYEGLPQSRM